MRDIVRKAGFICTAASAALFGFAAQAADPGVGKDKIVIGAYLPLQSGLAAGANQVREGVDAYFRHINAQGGVHGRKIEWIVENDSYNPQQTVAVVKKLIDRDGVFAIVSTLGTSTNLAALPFLVRRGVPLINPIGGHQKLNAPKDRNVFGLLPLGERNGEALAQYALDVLKAKRVAIFNQNDKFGTDIRDGAFDELKKRGMKPAAETTYVPSDVDVSAQVASMRKANADAVICACITKHGALLIKEAQKLNWKPHFVALNTMGDPIAADLTGPALDGTIINLFVAVDTMKHPKVQEATRILAKYYPKTKPGYWTYMGMAGAIVFVEGLQRAGKDVSRQSFIEALESLGNFEPGVVPPVKWDRKNHGSANVIGFAKWQGGKLQVLKGW